MLGLGGRALVIDEWGGHGPIGMFHRPFFPIPQAGNYDLVVIQEFHVIFGEDGDAVVIIELTHGYE